MDTTNSAPQRIELGRQDAPRKSSNALFRTLTAIHEEYARVAGTALSAFLQSNLQLTLKEVSGIEASSFLNALPSPACLMVFRLQPRADQMYLNLDAPTVFRILELLLGGSGGGAAMAARNLTEIEWSLLEEVIRVLVRPLAESWLPFAEIEFEVDSLVSEPALLPPPELVPPLTRMAFEFRIGEEKGVLEIALPTSFFDNAGSVSDLKPSASSHDLEQRKGRDQRIGRLQDAAVELEVRLEGPTASFRDLLALQPGHILSFAYPLDAPLHGFLNGEASLGGQIVNRGRKRAFCVTTLPEH